MKEKKRSFIFPMILLVIGLLLIILVSASVGSSSISILDSLKVIIYKIPKMNKIIDASEINDIHYRIVYQIRLPRILLSGLVGGGLAVVGCAFQGLFRNPLADPHILGVSSGAALGATIAMLSGLSLNVAGLGLVGLFAFIGALLTVILVYVVAGVGKNSSISNVLLTGTAVSTLLSSIVSLLMTFNREQLEKVYMWTLGSFSGASWSKILFLLIFVLVCCTSLIFYGKELNVILTGEDAALTLGINLKKVKRHIILWASLLVAACVSVSGIIGFVGLIIPHCIRLISGPNHKRLLPYSIFAGAIFMILCDTIARTIAAPSEIPVGVVTAIFGAPYFIFLLYYSQRKAKL